jgi:hypothetical protein
VEAMQGKNYMDRFNFFGLCLHWESSELQGQFFHVSPHALHGILAIHNMDSTDSMGAVNCESLDFMGWTPWTPCLDTKLIPPLPENTKTKNKRNQQLIPD